MTQIRAAHGRLPSTAVLLLTLATHPSNALDWRKPWTEPRDSAAAAQSSDEYAWALFVALNWPAKPAARAADRAARFGSPRPVVWETWRSAGEVYLEDGADPGPWSRGGATQPLAPERRFETISLKDLPKARHIVAGVMVPLADPIASAKRLTEIRMNQTTFDYIRGRQLYNLEGQLRAYNDGSGVDFPYGAKEVKAKWRPISESESSHYRTTLVTLADGTKQLYGLTGLHIASKDLPHWFWATFEHVDNPTLPDNEGWQLPSRDRFSCGAQPADCNRTPPKIGLEATVWQFYRLRGTLTGFVDAAGTPELLANSELEAGMQKTASCITCHSRSSIGIFAGASARLPIFDDPRARRGFSGLPRADWYQRTGPDGQPQRIYQPLDFVWSLSKARPKTPAVEIAPGLSRNMSDEEGSQ